MGMKKKVGTRLRESPCAGHTTWKNLFEKLHQLSGGDDESKSGVTDAWRGETPICYIQFDLRILIRKEGANREQS